MKSEITKEEFQELVELQRRMAALSVQAKKVADSCGRSRRELAERMGNASASTVQRLVGGAAFNASVETLARFAWACGYEIHVEFRPRKQDRNRQVGLSAASGEEWNLSAANDNHCFGAEAA